MIYFWYFVIYSFFGFVLESSYAFLKTKKVGNCKCFLLSPLCPVYGFGAVFSVLLLNPVNQNMVLVFLGGFFVCSLVEYITGYIYERLMHVSFWDYSKHPLNIHGRICLPFSMVWGILILGLIYFVHPTLKNIMWDISPRFTWLALGVLLFDGLVSIKFLRKNRSVKSLNWINKFYHTFFAGKTPMAEE